MRSSAEKFGAFVIAVGAAGEVRRRAGHTVTVFVALERA